MKISFAHFFGKNSGSQSGDGYEPDADRAVAPEKQKAQLSTSMTEISAYQKLLAQGVSHEKIYKAETENKGLSKIEMLKSHQENGDIVPKAMQQENSFKEMLTQKDALAFQQVMSMGGELPENGAQATLAGAQRAAQAVQMMAA